MSYFDHAAARRVKGLRGTTQAVFHEIAFRTKNDDGLHECSVRVATLAEALGKADQAIRLAIKELKGANLIQTTRRLRKNGTRSCFSFKLIMPFPDSVIVPDRAPRKPQPAVISTAQPAVISTAQPAVISTALLSGSSLDQGSSLNQGFIQKIEASASPSPSPSTEEKTLEKIPTTGLEPPNSACPPIDAVVNRYRKNPTPTAFLACMHELRRHLGLKPLAKFPKDDHMNVPGLFEVLGSPLQAFDALADFARTWATMPTGKRPHFCPRAVFLYRFTPKFADDAAICKNSQADTCDDIPPPPKFVVDAAMCKESNDSVASP
jgi:hypothetical protein